MSTREKIYKHIQPCSSIHSISQILETVISITLYCNRIYIYLGLMNVKYSGLAIDSRITLGIFLNCILLQTSDAKNSKLIHS